MELTLTWVAALATLAALAALAALVGLALAALIRGTGTPADCARLMNAGALALDRGDRPKAARCYARAAARIARLPVPTAELQTVMGQALQALGGIHAADGRAVEAAAAYDRALRLTRAPADTVEWLAAYHAGAEHTSAAAIEAYLLHLRSLRGGLPATDGDAVTVLLERLCTVTDGAEEDAADLSARVIDADPDLGWAHLAHGLALARLDRATEALAALGEAERLLPDRADIPFAIGRLHHRRNETQAAYRAYGRSLALAPDQPEALYQMAALLYRFAQHTSDRQEPALAEAADLLQRACGLSPQRADLYHLLGQVYQLAGKAPLAHTPLAKAVELKPEDAGYRTDLAALLADLNDAPGAIEQLRQAVVAQPDQPRALARLADLLRAQLDFAEAEAEYRRVLQLEPEWRDARLGLGLCLSSQARWTEAVDALTGVAEPSPEALLALGRALAQCGRLDEAAATYARCRRETPSTEAAFRLGCVQAHRRAWPAAVEALEEAARVATRGEVHLFLGLALVEDGRTDEAARAYEAASGLSPADPRIPYARGRLALRRGDADAARAEFARAVEVGPEFAPAHFALGALSEQAGDRADARRIYPTALRLDPDAPADPPARAHGRQARRQMAAGRRATAKQGVAEALRLDPHLEDARTLQAAVRDPAMAVHIRAGELEEAAAAGESELRERPTDLDLMHRLAILHYRLASAASEGKEAEANLDALGSRWQAAIALWAAVLHSPAFWVRWREERRVDARLELSDDDAAAVQAEPEERLLRELRDYAADCWVAGRPAAARRFQDWELSWSFECATARLMNECALDQRVDGWPDGFACGPLLLERWRAGGGGALVDALERAASTRRSASGLKLAGYLSPQGRVHYLLDENRPDEAMAVLEARTGSPESAELLARALSLKAREWAQLGRTEEALTAFERAAAAGAELGEHAATLADLCVQRAKVLLGGGQAEQAVAALESGLRIAGDHPDLRANLGVAYGQQAREFNNEGRHEEAAVAVRRALECAPDDAAIRRSARVALMNLAGSLPGRDDPRAVDLLREALACEDDADTARRLAMALGSRALREAQAGRSASQREAADLIGEAMQVHPETRGVPEADARRGLNAAFLAEARRLEDDSRLDEALELAAQAGLVLDNAATRRTLADLWLATNRPDEAIRTLREAPAYALADPELKHQLYITMSRHGADLAESGPGDAEAGIALLREALSLEAAAKAGQAAAKAGQAAAEAGQAAAEAGQAAAEAGQAAADTRRRLHAALYTSGVAWVNQRDYDRGIERLREALSVADEVQTRGQLAVALGIRGVERYNAGDRAGGRQDLQEAVRLDPRHERLKQALADVERGQ